MASSVYSVWSYGVWSYSVWLYGVWSYSVWLYGVWSYGVGHIVIGRMVFGHMVFARMIFRHMVFGGMVLKADRYVNTPWNITPHHATSCNTISRHTALSFILYSFWCRLTYALAFKSVPAPSHSMQFQSNQPHESTQFVSASAFTPQH